MPRPSGESQNKDNEMSAFTTMCQQASEGEDDNSRKEYTPRQIKIPTKELSGIYEERTGGTIYQTVTFSGIKEEIEVDANPDGNRKEPASADYLRRKMPGLVNLALPSTPEFQSYNPLNDSCTGNMDFSHDADNDDSTGSDSPVVDPLPKSMPLRTFARLKSRLQDPPPLTPAMKNHLTYCSSSLAHRRASVTAANTEAESATADCCSINAAVSKEEADQAVSAENDSGLAHSPSNSKHNGTVFPNREEEPDPFDEEFVPGQKKEKESKWLVVVQWCSLFVLVALLVSSVEIPTLEKVLFLGLNLWRWQALTLVILCGHLISGWIMKLFVSLIEKHYLLKKKVLYFVYGLRHCVKNCIWLALVVGVWEVIFQGHEDTTAVSIITKILWCLFTASLSWMLKVLVVKVAASNFYRTAYFDKIQECLFNQYLLERLSGPPTMGSFLVGDEIKTGLTITKPRKHQRRATGSLENEKFLTQKELLKVQSKNQQPQIVSLDSSSPWKKALNSKLTGYWQKGCRRFGSEKLALKEESFRKKEKPRHSVIEVGCASPVTNTSRQLPDKTAFSRQIPITAKSAKTIQHEKLQGLTSETVSVWTLKKLMKIVRNTNLKTYSSMLSHEKEDIAIISEVQAKAVAKKVFYNMTRPGQKCITMTNFLYFLDKDQAPMAFSMFDTTETGEITKKAFAKWVVNVYKERRALCLTLNDNKTIIEKLHRVLNGVLALILIAAFVLIFGVDTSKVLLFVSSVIIPSVFMFGNAAKVLFESLIFLFVTHPFDVGDRISVEGQTMFVEEMNILHTIFLSASNEKVYYPNFLLAAKPIANYYRSPDQWDSIEFQIHMKTPLEKLTELKERLQRYIEGLPQFWYPDFRMACKDIEDSTKMKMGIWMRHHLNFQEGGERLQRRSTLLLYLKQQLEELRIGYQLPQQEIIVMGIPVTHVSDT